MKLLQTNPEGINDDLAKLFKIYPNPTPGRFTIESGDQGNKIISVSITDLSGKLVHSAAFNSESLVHIDLSAQAGGAYIINIITQKGMITKILDLAH